jgi:hypothetical protein
VESIDPKFAPASQIEALRSVRRPEPEIHPSTIMEAVFNVLSSVVTKNVRDALKMFEEALV